MSTIVSVATVAYAEWRRHRTIRLGAAVAYYALFATIPLLMLSLAVVDMVADDDQITSRLEPIITDALRADVGDVSLSLADALDGSGPVLGLVGLISLAVSASMLFVAIQDAFDLIWEVPMASGWATVTRRLRAASVVGFTALVAVATLVISSILQQIRDLGPPGRPAVSVALDLSTTVALWALLLGVLAALYHYLAGGRPAWRMALISAGAAAAAIVVGNRLFGLYIEHLASASFAGAASSLLAGVLWFYLTAQALLAGAELCRALVLTAPCRVTAAATVHPGCERDRT